MHLALYGARSQSNLDVCDYSGRPAPDAHSHCDNAYLHTHNTALITRNHQLRNPRRDAAIRPHHDEPTGHTPTDAQGS